MLIDKKMLKFSWILSFFLRVDFAICRVDFAQDLEIFKISKIRDKYGFFGNDFSRWGWHAYALI